MIDATLSTEELPTSTAPSEPDAAEASDATAAADTASAAFAASAAATGLLEPDALPTADQDSESEQDSETAEGPDLQLGGGTLSDEELAAVTAVLGTLAGASGVEHNGAGSAGPSDRTLQRRRRLGLWGRPGPDSWKHAAGLR